MCKVNLLGAVLETVAFLVDGKLFAGARAINYLSNGLCFLGTVTTGLLWCLYVDLRTRRDHEKMLSSIRIVIIPWVVEVASVAATLAGTGFLFGITQDNVYVRGPGAPIGYISLVIYFAYSFYLVARSRRQGIDLRFFPIHYFVGPCLAGVALQFCFYGITTSWISVALALTFVQMQTYAENLYKDGLSGLYNRRYLTTLLEKHVEERRGSLWGIMLDVNDFKDINDTFGHNAGDRAVGEMGDVLFRSIPADGVAVRFAGDEFVVLLPGANEGQARLTMHEIEENLAQLSASGVEPFGLSVSMGCARLDPDEGPEAFLRKMDDRMYEAKRAFHGQA